MDQVRYLICATADEEENERINFNFGFGGISTTTLYQSERNVLSGELDEDYELPHNSYGRVSMYVLPIRDEDAGMVALIGVD